MKLLIFDLDGTLIDTLQDLTNAVNYSIQQFGYSALNRQTVQRFVGDGMYKLMERSMQDPPEQLLKQGIRYFQQYYSRHHLDETKPYDGIREMLEHYSDYQKAVLTNKPEVYAREIVDHLELSAYFGMVVGAKADISLKPSPEGISIILEQMKVLPRDTIMIGDSGNDILAGKAAGVKTCAVGYGFRDLENLKAFSPDFMAESPAVLQTLFE